MRIPLISAGILIFSCLVAYCQHFDPLDSVRHQKILNIAIINNADYTLIRDAQCTITTNTNDDVNTQLNPDAILLEANYSSLSIDCHAPDYTQQALAITNTVNDWSASDLFILPPGDIVDLSSNLLPYYPSHILVLMSHKSVVDTEITTRLYRHAQENNELYQRTTA
ncbi:MAG: hypothetical protein LRY67_00660 [Gammaproteobacteria bacterium]|nr:hypothetical protein [Gammaproteobacteria bacterium]MCD8542726.1 hypothetical protein [Gammaproteobacteria bacterium]